MKKKLLSLILAITVIASILPAMALSASAEEIEIVYDLNPAAASATYVATSVDETTYEEYGWMYYYKTGGTAKGYLQSSDPNYVDVRIAPGQYFAIKIKVENSALYDMTLIHYQNRNSGGYVDIYLLPGNTETSDIESKLDGKSNVNEERVKCFSGTTSRNANVKETFAKNYPIQQGEYILVFHSTAVGEYHSSYSSTTANGYICPASITLTKTGEIDTTDYADYTFSYDLNPTDDTNKVSIVDEIDYADTKGMLEWGDYSGDCSVVTHNWGIEIRATDVGQWVAFKINIPVAGTYKASLTHGQSKSMGGYGNVYLLPGNTADISAALPNATPIRENVEFVNTSNSEYVPTSFEEKVTAETAGEYLLVFEASKIGEGSTPSFRMYPNTFTLTGDGNNPSYAGVVTVPSEIENGTTVTDAVKVWNTATGEEITDGITLVSSNTGVATVVSGTSITAIAAGDTTITATCSSPAVGNIIGADVTVVPTAQEKVDAAFDAASEDVEYTPSALTGLTVDGEVINGVSNGDGTYNLTAPEKNDAGYSFCYWAKGNVAKKRILLFQTNELKNYVPDEKGVTYLIPVYEDMLPSTDEYYNANGQLIPDAKNSDRPYMAGYGKASGWNKYGDTNIYVAEYNNKTQPDNVTVTVVGGLGTDTVSYGDPVICTADDANGTFRWWQREVNGTQEIVSVDKEYSFLAYETCTVTAVYGDSSVTVTNPVKIIIDTFGENSVMAEFIGFKNKTVLEKGIMFGENRIAMTAPGNQFTVTADKNGTFKGYAIVEDGDSYTLITDGEVTINNLAE